MIASFRHKELRLFFETGSTTGIPATRARRLRTRLAALDAVATADEIPQAPGWRVHPLKGDMDGRWSLTVTGNWRITFGFREGNAYVLDYEDYH
ncbi:MAG TPA: type II toxin-antitoxin system RelE/ParE family toxin [Microbacteriaceae bacterium]|nr:type II toxin-antitoxin system RelE/ParE family toxin [Microbacteriaceae bacterium]